MWCGHRGEHHTCNMHHCGRDHQVCNSYHKTMHVCPKVYDNLPTTNDCKGLIHIYIWLEIICIIYYNYHYLLYFIGYLVYIDL